VVEHLGDPGGALVVAVGRDGGGATDADVVVVAELSGQIVDALGKVRGLAGKVAIDTTDPYAGRNETYPSLSHEVKALVADPLAEVERLYARLGLELSGAARQRMRRWIGRHHHRGRGRPHRYSLADFGLDPAVVDRRFARYREWVPVATSS
jgi:hypothetical protein